MQVLDLGTQFAQSRSMVRSVKYFVLLCWRAWLNLSRNNGVEMAGYLTFVMLMSIFPYLLLMVSALGTVGQRDSGRQFIELVLEHLPPEAVKTLYPSIIEMLSGPPKSVLTFAFVSAIWTSSSAIEGVRKILNRAYCVEAPPAYLRRRLTSIVQVIAFTVLILAVIGVLVLMPIVMHYFTSLTGIDVPIKFKVFMNTYFLYIGGFAMYVIVAALYYVLPNLKQTRRRVIPGALLVVGLWLIGAFGVSYYLTKVSQLTLVYGSLSGLIATLIFFFVMILIFIYGAEFNHELIIARGEEVVPQDPRKKSLTPS